MSSLRPHTDPCNTAHQGPCHGFLVRPDWRTRITRRSSIVSCAMRRSPTRPRLSPARPRARRPSASRPIASLPIAKAPTAIAPSATAPIATAPAAMAPSRRTAMFRPAAGTMACPGVLAASPLPFPLIPASHRSGRLGYHRPARRFPPRYAAERPSRTWGGRYRGTMLSPSDGPAARSEQQHEAPQFLDGLVGWMVARRGRAAERGSDTPALRAVVDADVADRACRLSGGSRSAAAKRPCPTSAPSRRRPWR